MTEYFPGCGLPMTGGSVGGASRDLRMGSPIVFWKSGRRSRGGMLGTEAAVLIELWLTVRLMGRLMKAPGYAARSRQQVRGEAEMH